MLNILTLCPGAMLRIKLSPTIAIKSSNQLVRLKVKNTPIETSKTSGQKNFLGVTIVAKIRLMTRNRPEILGFIYQPAARLGMGDHVMLSMKNSAIFIRLPKIATINSA